MYSIKRMAPRLPLWVKILAVMVFICMVLGIYAVVRVHNTYYTYPEDEPPIGLIVTIVITGVIAIANIFLVGYTKSYAELTSKMVDFYYDARKHDLRPLFVPHGEGYELSKRDNFNTVIFKFTNAGDLALSVKMKIDKREFEFHKVESWEEVETDSLEVAKMISNVEKKKSHERGTSQFTLFFTDKVIRAYKQSIKFHWINRHRGRFEIGLSVQESDDTESQHSIH